MKRTPCKSCNRSREIGAGCSQSSHRRLGGCAVASGSCKQAGRSVAPAPIYERRQTDRQTDNRQTDRSGECSLCLLCPPLCRGRSERSSGRGRSLSVVGVGWLGSLRYDLARRRRLLRECAPASVVVRRLRGTTPPAARLRGGASRHSFGKRLHPYRVAYASRETCQGWRGFFLRDASGLVPVLVEGVIL
jgi:hypothetical protein